MGVLSSASCLFNTADLSIHLRQAAWRRKTDKLTKCWKRRFTSCAPQLDRKPHTSNQIPDALQKMMHFASSRLVLEACLSLAWLQLLLSSSQRCCLVSAAVTVLTNDRRGCLYSQAWACRGQRWSISLSFCLNRAAPTTASIRTLSFALLESEVL